MFEPNFRLGRGGLRWERILFVFGLTAALAILSSCGSSTSTTVTPTITISCTPSSVTLLATSQCTANVLNLSSTLVNWTVSGTVTGGNFGSITSGGLYTAPGAIPGTNGTANVVTITATSQVQSTLTATQNITLVLPTAISAVTCFDSQNNPSSSVSSGNKLQCAATASTGAFVPVNWSVANTNFPAVTTNLGSISTQGIYTAALVPPPGQSITITATSQALATEKMTTSATVVFGNRVLSGTYAFSTSGKLTNAPTSFFARVGSLSAGGGTLTGFEDTNQTGEPAGPSGTVATTQIPFTGSYSIFPDGRGTMQFCEGITAPTSCPPGSNSATSFFQIVVISPQQAQIVDFSPTPTSSALTAARGDIISQDQSVFGAGDLNLNGTYSFNFAGVTSGSAEESAIGEFTSNGHGTIAADGPFTPGKMDINPGGSQTFSSLSAYSVSSNGRGAGVGGTPLTLGGLNFSFYMVSASHAKFIEIDPSSVSILVGDAFKQESSVICGWGANALSNSVVFETSGASSGVRISDVGSFAATSATTTNGTVTAGSIDENSGGTYTPATGNLTGAYTVAPCGRGALTIGSHSYIFYPISTASAVLQEITSGIVGHGYIVQSQGGAFSDSTLNGGYAIALSGTDAGGNREDSLGQFTSVGTGKALAGMLDVNDFGATQTGVTIANGMYSANPAATLRVTMSLPLTPASGTATTRNLVLYMVSPTLFYALGTDSVGTAVGTINNQF